jgi:hypothetical protein
MAGRRQLSSFSKKAVTHPVFVTAAQSIAGDRNFKSTKGSAGELSVNDSARDHAQAFERSLKPGGEAFCLFYVVHQ